MKEFWIFLYSVGGFFFGLILLAVFGIYPLNNWEAHKIAAWLRAVELPRDSRLLRQDTSVANFGAAGNACYFAAGEMRTASLSRKDLESFYAKRIGESNALTGASSMRTFNIYFPGDEENWQYGLDDRFRGLLKDYADAFSTSTVYLALAVDGPHEPGLDFRCH